MDIDNPEADAVVLRALSKDREERFDDVESFTSALVEALGGQAEEVPLAWAPAGTELTEAAARPADTDRLDGSALPTAPPRRPLLPWLVAATLALVGGFGIGWGVEQSSTSEQTVEDSTGRIEVTVPESWTTQVDPEQWVPPLEGQSEQPALATGSRRGWNTADDPAPGVFVGLLQSEKLPARVPQHPTCEDNGQPIEDLQDGDRSRTVYFEGCPGADVIVERVVQLTSNRVLWVQVASDDERTASRVLESVRTYGF